MPEFAVRSAATDEVTAVAACVAAAYAAYVPRIGREPAPMRADYAALIAGHEVFVIPGEGAVHGVLVLVPGEDYLLIENVAVHPDQQGRGLGRRLMRFAEERAAALGLGEIRLYTHEMMSENIIYYGKLGYEEMDRRTEDGYRRVYLRKAVGREPRHQSIPTAS